VQGEGLGPPQRKARGAALGLSLVEEDADVSSPRVRSRAAPRAFRCCPTPRPEGRASGLAIAMMGAKRRSRAKAARRPRGVGALRAGHRVQPRRPHRSFDPGRRELFCREASPASWRSRTSTAAADVWSWTAAV